MSVENNAIITEYANCLFEQPWWLNLVTDNWEEILVKNDKEEIIARAPIAVSGKSVVRPHLTQNIGVWMRQDIVSDYSAQKNAISEIEEKIKKYKSVDRSLAPENKYVLPYRWHDYRIEPRFTYRISDLSDMDALYQSFNKTAKKNIKYARNKVSLRYDTNVDVLIDMLDKTYEAQKRRNPVSGELVKRIVEYCDKTGHGKYIDAVDEMGNVHSCAYFVYDEKVCYYLLGASDSTYRNSGAQSLILWEGIQFASGVSRAFDFEGSMVEGIEHFFKQFGGECIPYYCVSRKGIFSELMDILKPRIKRLIGYKL